MTTALQLRETDAMAEWGVIREKAAILVKSKFLPKSIETPEQALAIILTGRELGIGDMQALNNINVIQGKPTVPPQLMLALINRTGQLEDMLITDDGQCCAVTMKRRGRQPHSEAFSMKDAALMKTTEYIGGEKKTISLSEKYNWKQQPAVMRKWRAVAACARVVFPDVILGLYTPDEMGATMDVETGEVIQAAPEATPAADCELREDVVEVIQDALTVAAVRGVKLEGAQPTRNPDDPRVILMSLNRELGFDDKQLLKWLTKKFPGLTGANTLTLAINALRDEEMSQAIDIFREKLESGGK